MNGHVERRVGKPRLVRGKPTRREGRPHGTPPGPPPFAGDLAADWANAELPAYHPAAAILATYLDGTNEWVTP